MTNRGPYLRWTTFAALALLAALPYLRSLWLPLISDDHLQILLSRQYGPISGWAALMADPLYRDRATSLLITHWTELLTGLSPFAFHLSSMVLHIVNTWLVLLLGIWPRIGWRLAAFAAAFFAVYEGHQEAVIWYAALPELLVFTFGMVSFVCWVAWIESDLKRARWLVASFAAFVLALFSKEPAAAVPALLILPLLGRPTRWRMILPVLALFTATAAAYFAMVYIGRSGNQHFHDGAFALTAPVARTVAYSTARLFWFCGLLGVVSLAAFRERKYLAASALAAGWILAGFLPYSFLTYMPFVPSRHTYLASAGLAIVVAGGFLTFAERLGNRRWVAVAAASIVVLGNAGYVWTRKHQQFLERAAPIRAIVGAARSAQGPIYVRCWPGPLASAEAAVVVELNKPAGVVRPWPPDAASGNPPGSTFCFDIQAPAQPMP